MSDRAPACIVIGGTVDKKTFAELTALIVAGGLSPDWEGEPFDPAIIVADEAVSLGAHEVRGGCFEALEAFCCAHALPFSRWSGSCAGAFGAERVVFTGAGAPRSYSADDEDCVIITRDTVEALASFDAVIAYFDEAAFAVPPLVVTD